MEREHFVEWSFSRKFSSIYIVRELWPPEIGSRSRRYQKRAFWKKTTPCGKTLKISFRKDSPPSRSTTCVQISWNLADRKSVKWCVIYVTKKAKKSARCSFCADSAQNLPGPAAAMYSQCPTFHPNRFTSGGVIVERVSTVQTRHKVHPILGEASASSPSN